ncbi:hypothetical protein [Ohtaekwangia koreensis]|uniref:Uncharacterized protein n=1 Tax=Ohtaekwangia koreensis TaxID=688867 RepID=A0A1T5KC59_9BACT|nr:hypothetical protein [Ohtaekwangia koreensis]SKC61224.1 hypothetical protein SAMN05660236_2021 [Ohtaekwangia koreensis]
MKPIFVIFFLLVVLSSSAFVVVYNYWKDIVEANPAIFAVGLMSIVVTGVGGMMYIIISRPEMEASRNYTMNK